MNGANILLSAFIWDVEKFNLLIHGRFGVTTMVILIRNHFLVTAHGKNWSPWRRWVVMVWKSKSCIKEVRSFSEVTVVENGQWLRIKAVSRKKSLGFNSSFDKKSCLGRMKVVERGLVGIYEDLDELVQD